MISQFAVMVCASIVPHAISLSHATNVYPSLDGSANVIVSSIVYLLGFCALFVALLTESASPKS